MSEPKLRVFTNGTDTVAAYDLADTKDLVEATYGTTFEAEGWSIDDWHEVADDKPITINLETDDGIVKETMLASEWAASEGRSLLCSTEY